MRVLIFIAVLFNMICGCRLNREYTIIKFKKINSIEDSPGRYCDYYRNNKLSGKIKIKGEYGEYIIVQYVDGFKNGMSKEYDRGKLKEIVNYRNGLWHGDRIYYYSNGQMKLMITYENGFAHGNVIWNSNYDGRDTLKINYYRADSLKMDVYIDEYSSFSDSDPLDRYVNTCLIKTNIYPIRYYLKKDSSLVAEKKWYKIDNCIYQSKEWGYSGAD